MASRLNNIIRTIKSQFMKNVTITNVETKTKLAEQMIEEHINAMHHPKRNLGNANNKSRAEFDDYESIDWRCEHSPAEGTVEISFSKGILKRLKHISMPVKTAFLVVCIKGTEAAYRLTWSSSLS